MRVKYSFESRTYAPVRLAVPNACATYFWPIRTDKLFLFERSDPIGNRIRVTRYYME